MHASHQNMLCLLRELQAKGMTNMNAVKVYSLAFISKTQLLLAF